MYKLQDKPDEFIKTDSFRILHPVVSLYNECGNKIHIVHDNKAYVLWGYEDHKGYHLCFEIFHEVLEVLKTLPSPAIKKY